MKNGMELNMLHLNLLMKQFMAFVRSTGKHVKNARLIANPGCYPTCSYFINIIHFVKEGVIDRNTIDN